MDNGTNTNVTEPMTAIALIMTCGLNVPVAVFGIVGNVFTLVMLVRKVIPCADSMRLKLISLTIADLSVVIAMVVLMAVQIISYLNPKDGNNLLRLAMSYIMESTVCIAHSISAYVVVFISIERIIAIVWPHRLKSI